MARKKNDVFVEDLTNVPLADLLKVSKEYMLDYGSLTVENRALPDYRDGCKPVHRRILYAAYKMGRNSKAAYVKSAKVVGECFAAGTKVTTPDGLVNIENLKIGDKVVTSKGVYNVTQLFENPPKDMVKLTLEDGRVILATLDQKVKVKQGDTFIWKSICELSDEDLIVSEV